jgi:hypothetical protein
MFILFISNNQICIEKIEEKNQQNFGMASSIFVFVVFPSIIIINISRLSRLSYCSNY